MFLIINIFPDEDYQPSNTPVLSELLTDELASERCKAVLSEIDMMINKIEVEEGNDNSSSKGGRKEDKEILIHLKRFITIRFLYFYCFIHLISIYYYLCDNIMLIKCDERLLWLSMHLYFIFLSHNTSQFLVLYLTASILSN